MEIAKLFCPMICLTVANYAFGEYNTMRQINLYAHPYHPLLLSIEKALLISMETDITHTQDRLLLQDLLDIPTETQSPEQPVDCLLGPDLPLMLSHILPTDSRHQNCKTIDTRRAIFLQGMSMADLNLQNK